MEATTLATTEGSGRDTTGTQGEVTAPKRTQLNPAPRLDTPELPSPMDVQHLQPLDVHPNSPRTRRLQNSCKCCQRFIHRALALPNHMQYLQQITKGKKH